MKQRPEPLPQRDADAALDGLARAFAALERTADVKAFLLDLCTPAELEAMSDRWKVVPLLLQGVPYREIHERSLVSVTTIGRVARTLEHGAGGYAAAIRRTHRALASSH
jgi:TrpR-related protein YerC/YecD